MTMNGEAYTRLPSVRNEIIDVNMMPQMQVKASFCSAGHARQSKRAEHSQVMYAYHLQYHLQNRCWTEHAQQ
jgi:hypothetical protein